MLMFLVGIGYGLVAGFFGGFILGLHIAEDDSRPAKTLGKVAETAADHPEFMRTGGAGVD